uniref:GDSL esterase/lipase At1g71691 n=1 Tax=Anthurium amnicola TaxID=1678845 RepID=A0A1D1YSR5_9ARAE
MANVIMAPSLLLAIAAMATISLVHAGTNPPPLFAFGDHFSDVGNNNGFPGAIRADHPHYGIDFPGGVPTGRFSNGYNIIDYIAQLMGFEQSPRAFLSGPLTDDDIYKGINFASAGSGILRKCVEGGTTKCLTMEMQINYFKQVKSFLESKLGAEAAGELISKSVFIFTLGSNDLSAFSLTSNLIDKFVFNLTSSFSDQLKELYDLGARKFAVINVPRLGFFPEASLINLIGFLGIDIQGILNMFSELFNAAQDLLLKELFSTLPGMKYSIGSANAVHEHILDNHEELGFKYVSKPCCGAVRFVALPPHVEVIKCTPQASYCSNRGEYVFWDHLNPTQELYDYVSKVYYYGNRTFAYPINFGELVEYESSAGGGLEAI